MADAQIPSLASSVKSYVSKFELDISRKLKSAKMSLLWCAPNERAYWKQQIETLSDVFHRLQGETEGGDSNSRQMKREISSLRSKLKKMETIQKRAANQVRCVMQINRKNKTALNRQFKRTMKETGTKKTLTEEWNAFREEFVTKLTSESANNNHLRSKIKSYEELKQLLSQRSTDSSDELCSSSEGASIKSPDGLVEPWLELWRPTVESEKLAVSIQDHEPCDRTGKKCNDTFVQIQEVLLCFNMKELESDPSKVEPIKVEDERVVSLTSDHLKMIVERAVVEYSNNCQAKLKSQRADIASLQSALKMAEELSKEAQQSLAALENRLRKANIRRHKKPGWINWLSPIDPLANSDEPVVSTLASSASESIRMDIVHFYL